MSELRFGAWWHRFHGGLRVLRGRITGNRREVTAGRLEQFLGRVQAAHERANLQLHRDLTQWRARHAEFFARHPRNLRFMR